MVPKAFQKKNIIETTWYQRRRVLENLVGGGAHANSRAHWRNIKKIAHRLTIVKVASKFV